MPVPRGRRCSAGCRRSRPASSPPPARPRRARRRRAPRAVRPPSAAPAAAASRTGSVTSSAKSDEHLERGDVGVDGALRARRAAGRVGCAERAARAEHVRPEPQQRHRRERERQEPERGALRAPQPQRVEAEERPHLRPAAARPRRRARAPPAAAPPRCATTAHTAAATSSPSLLPSAVLNSHHDESAIAAPAATAATVARGRVARAGELGGQERGARDREQAARAGDDEPERGAASPVSASGVVDDDGQRLPRRAAGGVQLQPRDVAAPGHPRPRVERERPREQQRQRGEREAGDDQDRARAARRHAMEVMTSDERDQQHGDHDRGQHAHAPRSR